MNESARDETSNSLDTPGMKIALVHDYLTQFGGAEQVLAVLATMYPDAPILTSLHDPAIALAGVDPSRIVESSLGKITPLRQRHRLGMPLFPMAMRDLSHRLADIDLVIADSSAWSHQIPVRHNQGLIAYCHSPARFLYGDPDYLGATNIAGAKAQLAHAAFAPFRYIDRRAWKRADLVLANSGIVADRLKASVGVTADVVYPPVDVEYFVSDTDLAREDYLLIVSRLVPHKVVDLAIKTANHHQIPLKIIGTGRDRDRLQLLAGPTVEFLGFQPRESVRNHLQRCLAFLLPGAEDFGMTAVEAQAAGAPVLAFKRGGATESVIHLETGFLFDEQSPANLMEAWQWASSVSADPERCRQNARRFGISGFESRIRNAVEQVAQARGLA